jgi:hypothetical protein
VSLGHGAIEGAFNAVAGIVNFSRWPCLGAQGSSCGTHVRDLSLDQTPRNQPPSSARHCLSRRRQQQLVLSSRRRYREKLLASTPIRRCPSHHTSTTSPLQCTTIRSRHSFAITRALFFWNLLDQVGSRKIPHPSPTNPSDTVIMLRRPATTIQLTVADVEQYEANRQRKLWEQQQTQQQDSSQSTVASENAKEQIQSNPMKSRKERIMGGNGRGN